MFFRQIESAGLAHYSYMVGEGKEVAVIDPKRDIGIYLEEARKEGLKIKYILETHRNEDYIIGSRELAERTGATIYISGHEDVGHVYGEKIFDGDNLTVGSLTIQGIHTPGHTLGHMSYGVYEEGRDKAYMVFTGDCLFMGDLGRTDFYGEENLEKMTGLLYDSVFEKLLSLGDEVLVFPAHGAGSACGDSMEDRPYSTLGYEKAYNPEMQVVSKEGFIKDFARMRIKPRYFEKMEKYNVEGAEFVGEEVKLEPLQLEEVKKQGITIIDARTKEAYFGGHIPGTLFFSVRNFSTYAGNILDTDAPVAFLVEGNDMEKLKTLYWYARRIGFENIKGYIADGNSQWEQMVKDLQPLPTITAVEYLDLNPEEFVMVDIRKPEDISPEDPTENGINIPLQHLYRDYEKLPKDKPIYILCGSGDRSATAASFLRNKGYDGRVVSGGLLTLKPLLNN